MLRPMRLLLKHMPTLSHGMIPSKFPGEAKFMPLLCPFLRAAKTIILFQVRSYGVKGVLELALGATLKPIIVYIVLLQTCSQPVWPFLSSSAKSLLSLEASCQNISLNKNLSDTNRTSDRLRTHLILRYIAETGVGAGVGKIRQKRQDGKCWILTIEFDNRYSCLIRDRSA